MSNLKNTGGMLSRRFLPVLQNNKTNTISNLVGNGAERMVLSQIPMKSNQNLKTLNENADNKFTFLTYNMLSPHYMWPQVYVYVPDQYKDWKYRHKLLEFELMQKYKADIMCLQELTWEDYITYWKPKCSEKLNYGSKFIAKVPPTYWQKTKQEMDGEGIFFNLEKFDYLSSTKLSLNDIVGTFEESEIEYMKKKMITLTDGSGKPVGTNDLFSVTTTRNQVCLFVSLRHKATNTIFVIINTHLYWKYDEVKLTQCMIIMRKLSHIINELLISANAQSTDGSTISKDVKIIFSGDLNSTRDSLVIRFLKGKIISHGNLNMINPMKPYLNRSCFDDIPEGLFDNTCYSGKLKGIFDYIWYHDTDLELKKILTGVEVSQELNQTDQFGLPNANHPSDHIPLLAEFEIR